jgi:hypothetical protein
MPLDYLDHAMRDAGSVELRHQLVDRWTSGLFNDVDALRLEVRRLASAGNCFISINAPKALPVSNAMRDRALTDADIVMHTRLVFDFDPVRPKGTPSTDAEMLGAVQARDRMVAVLLGCGWPRPATAASGNGAHALYRVRMPVSEASVEMLATMYRGMKLDFGTEVADFDTTVRNPARIWRLYGTVNRKGAPTPTRPHRRALVNIPGRWDAVSPRQVEALATMYARRPGPHQHEHRHQHHTVRVDGTGDYTSLDVVAWFRAHGHYRRHLDADMHAVICPWHGEHSTVDGEHSTSTVVWTAHDRCWPSYKCQHSHCAGRGIRDVLALWSDADAYCSRAWRTSP